MLQGGPNESVKKTVVSSTMIRSMQKKQKKNNCKITTMEKSKGAKSSNSKKMPYNKGKQILSYSSTFLMKQKSADTTLLEQWIKDNVIHLPKVEFRTSVRDLKDLKYCRVCGLGGQKQKYDAKTSKSFNPPQSSKQIRFNKKKRACQGGISVKDQIDWW